MSGTYQKWKYSIGTAYFIIIFCCVFHSTYTSKSTAAVRPFMFGIRRLSIAFKEETCCSGVQWATHTLTGCRSETNLRTAAASSSPSDRGSGGSCQTNAVMCKANLPIQPPESSAGRQRWHNWAGYYKYFFFFLLLLLLTGMESRFYSPFFSLPAVLSKRF